MRRFLRRATYTPPFYWFWTHLLRFVLVVLTRWEAKGRERVPLSGPLIVVSNHLSNGDPPILASGVLRRRIRYMAKIELFRLWPVRFVMTLYGAFPVRRFEADVAALLNAERILKRGEVLGMFPEGTRSRERVLGRPHPGTAMIALRSGATILPCAITGTEVLSTPWKLLRRPPITVTVGEPMAVAQVRRPTEQQVSELTDRIFSEIRRMLPVQYLPTYTEMQEAEDTANGRDTAGV
jgi:1-acyl-sn-glycerol-3-phosphate acyltransferase